LAVSRHNGKERRSYISALEYAHRHIPERYHERYKPGIIHPLRFLSRWVEKRLVEIDLTEATPP